MLVKVSPVLGLVLEGDCLGVWHVGPLHGGDGEHGGGCDLHPHYEQHRARRLSDHLQLHSLEQLRLRHGDHPPQGTRWEPRFDSPSSLSRVWPAHWLKTWGWTSARAWKFLQ